MSNPLDGFVALPKFILQHPDLTPEAIVLYSNLLHFDRGGGRGCFAKRETISKFSNMSLHKVRNAIKVLEANGIISVVRRRNSLTDVIRINPDCRPQIKEARQRARKSVSARPKPISTSRNTQEIKDFDTSSIKSNKITQVNNTLPTDTLQRVKNNHETTGKQSQETTIPPNPNPIHVDSTEEHIRPQSYLKHQVSTETILGQLKEKLRPQSYQTWFKDVFVANETDNQVEIFTPKGLSVANLIKDNYISTLETITHKQVSVIG